MMGTRSGSVDPGILIHLLNDSGRYLSAKNLDHALNHESGLLGISGLSSDMRDIIGGMNEGNDRARLAFEIFVHRLRSSIAAMAASTGGLDALVFTAGIGENSPEVREAACANLGFLGLKLDQHLNLSVRQDAAISRPESPVKVLVIRAQEDWAIARKCLRFSQVTAQSS
jgi:acetate kinase